MFRIFEIKKLKKEIEGLRKSLKVAEHRAQCLEEQVVEGVLRLGENKRINNQVIKERDFYRAKLRKEKEEDLALISLRILIQILTQQKDEESLESLRDKQKIQYEEWL